MAVLSKEALREATIEGGELVLKLQGCYYAKRAMEHEGSERLASFISKRLSRSPAWVVRSSLAITPKREKEPSGPQASTCAFLEVTFSTSCETLASYDAADAFDGLFKQLGSILKNRKIKGVLGMDKRSLTYWSLICDNNLDQLTMGRSTLPPPETPITYPAELIEEVVYKLCRLGLDHIKDGTHARCGKKAALGCIEHQLYIQKQSYNKLNELMTKLGELEAKKNPLRGSIEWVVEESILAVKDLDKAVTTLVALFLEHVDRATPPRCGCKLVRKLWSFIKGPFVTLEIDDNEVGGLKKNVSRELATFKRIAPVLAAHIRLRDRDRKDELKMVCATAANGPEKCAVPEKIGIEPGLLDHAPSQKARLERVFVCYNESYSRVLARAEAFNKAINADYFFSKEAAFNLHGEWARFSREGVRLESCAAEMQSTREREVTRIQGWEKATW